MGRFWSQIPQGMQEQDEASSFSSSLGWQVVLILLEPLGWTAQETWNGLDMTWGRKEALDCMEMIVCTHCESSILFWLYIWIWRERESGIRVQNHKRKWTMTFERLLAKLCVHNFRSEVHFLVLSSSQKRREGWITIHPRNPPRFLGKSQNISIYPLDKSP